jgi:hypothetical protein
MNRFDLEEQMSSLWNTKDDIDLLCETISSKHPETMDQDEIVNALIGISHLHAMRMDRVFETFKELISCGVILNGRLD